MFDATQSKTYIDRIHFREWTVYSGISEEITEINLETYDDKEEIAEFLGWKGYGGRGGWVCRSIDIENNQLTGVGQFKPDTPYEFLDKSTAKYLSPKSGYDALALSMPDHNYWEGVKNDISQTIHITEGAKKAASLLSEGYPTLALVGVTMWQKDGKLVHNIKCLVQPGRRIIILFDADQTSNEKIRYEQCKLGRKLTENGCDVYIASWDIDLGKGIDDVKVNMVLTR
ncbi:MAG: DUF3854 domain-containing protein [Synechococcaceae cyanobacterium SM2_3_1]|nr:DUF3854 domain-containing protein [Synechococcaceae cyanobacterium SM2_3_1]